MGRYALDGFSDLIETIDHVKNNSSQDNSEFIRILLTKFESRNKITNEWVLDQLEPYKSLIFKTAIRKNEALNQAHMAQEHIFTFKAACAGAEDYKSLTNELLNLCQ